MYQVSALLPYLLMILDEVLQDRCPICYLNYNQKHQIPMMVCLSQHLCCKKCVDEYYKENSNCFKCHICKRTDFVKNQIKKFRYYNCIQNSIKNAKKSKYFESALIQLLKKQREDSLFLVNPGKSIELRNLIRHHIDQARLSLKLGHIKEASGKLQDVIDKFCEFDEDQFIGLGYRQESHGHYQKNVMQWFQMKYKQKNISAFDVLAICYLVEPNYQQQISWYEKTLKKYPKNNKIAFGLAVALHNSNKIQQAQKIYLQITQRDPLFSKAWQNLGYVYASDSVKCVYYANKCLSIDPKNIYARFLVCRLKLQEDKSISNIMQMQSIQQDQRQYVLPLYIAAHYFQDQQQAIRYCQICIEINPHFLLAQIGKAEIFIHYNRKQEAIQILKRVYKKKSLTQHQRDECNRVLGFGYYELSIPFIRQKYDKAIKYFKLYFDDKNYKKNLFSFELFVHSYFKNNQKKKARRLCKLLLTEYPNDRKAAQKFEFITISLNFRESKYRQTIQGILQYKRKYPQNKLPQCYYHHLITSYRQIGQFKQSQKWRRYLIDEDIEPCWNIFSRSKSKSTTK